jgi:hypothetical protein
MSTRTLRTLTWLLVGAIAAIAFAVSFEAISQYAVQVGAFPGSLRYCAPLLVDAFTVAPGWSSWPAPATASEPSTPGRWWRSPPPCRWR